MTAAFSTSLHLPTERATAAFAAALAPMLGPGDTLLLSGPVGAGKSHFARALIKARLAAAGTDEDVPSPTYTLVQTYRDGVCEIWHADLYRLTSADELVELGMDMAFETDIVLVEWPERLGSLAPKGALSIELSPGKTPEAREARLWSGDDRWRARIDRAADVLDHA